MPAAKLTLQKVLESADQRNDAMPGTLEGFKSDLFRGNFEFRADLF